MPKQVIALDFDDVVADSSELFRQFLNQHYGTKLAREELTDFYFEKNWKIPRDELDQRWMEFDLISHTIEPMRHAQGFLAKLAEQRELHIVTSRPTSQRESTEKWLKAHSLGHFAELHFCTSAQTLRAFRTKSSVCKNIGAAIILEDHPANAITCATDGIHVYLFDQPWNRRNFPLLAGGIFRVMNWQDAILMTLLT